MHRLSEGVNVTNEQTLLTLLTLGVLVPTILWLGYVVPSIISSSQKDNGNG